MVEQARRSGLRNGVNMDQRLIRNWVNQGLISQEQAEHMLAVLAFPSPSSVWVVVFNLLFPSLVLLVLCQGYARVDLRVINLGISWGAAFLLAKYFGWFWSLLDRSLFFLLGGVFLVGGGIVLEKRRRRIKSRFGR